MTTLVHKLGLSEELAWHDVFSIDDPELLAFVPRPAHALLVVFPVSQAYEKARIEEDEPLPEYTGSGSGEEVLWFKQTIGNACGLYGLLHSVCNGVSKEFIGKESQNLEKHHWTLRLTYWLSSPDFSLCDHCQCHTNGSSITD